MWFTCIQILVDREVVKQAGLDCGTVCTPNVLPGGRMPRDYKQRLKRGSVNSTLPGELGSIFEKKKLSKRYGDVTERLEERYARPPSIERNALTSTMIIVERT